MRDRRRWGGEEASHTVLVPHPPIPSHPSTPGRFKELYATRRGEEEPCTWGREGGMEDPGSTVSTPAREFPDLYLEDALVRLPQGVEVLPVGESPRHAVEEDRISNLGIA